MIRKSAIVSISKTRLSIIEKKILKKYKPWGIILFSRNIKSSDQLRRLTKEIRTLMSDRKYPIMVDEEGGTVTRLANIIENPYSQIFPIEELLSFINLLTSHNLVDGSITKYFSNSMP